MNIYPIRLFPWKVFGKSTKNQFLKRNIDDDDDDDDDDVGYVCVDA